MGDKNNNLLDSADEESTDEDQTVVPVAEVVEEGIVEQVVEAGSGSGGTHARHANFMSQMAQFFDAMNHQKENMLRMTNVSDEDVRRGEELTQSFKEFYEHLEIIPTNYARSTRKDTKEDVDNN
jgi:hypothetical protein